MIAFKSTSGYLAMEMVLIAMLFTRKSKCGEKEWLDEKSCKLSVSFNVQEKAE